MGISIVCNGTIDQVSETVISCSEAWTMQAIQTELAIDPVLFAGAVGAGFFCLLPLWVATFGGKWLLKAIR